jgi:hypothetical protein
MTHLVTLAHKVSRIHARYSEIHSSLFSWSFKKLISRSWNKCDHAHCRYEKECITLNEELDQVLAIVNCGDELEPKTTFSKEFVSMFVEYIQDLSTAISRLSVICAHQCQEDMGVGVYSEAQSRIDRTAYDESIQVYQKLGKRLNLLVKKL